MELKDLRLALRRHWLLASVAFVASLVIGAAGVILPARTYHATAVVVATPNPEAPGNPVQNANFQIPAVLATIQGSEFRRAVREKLPEEVVGRAVRVTTSSDPGSGLIRIAVEGGHARTVAEWASGLAAHAIETQPSAEYVSLSLLEAARVPRSAESSDPLPIMLGAFVLGILAAIFAALVAFRTRRALDIVEELRSRLHMLILGEIPTFRALRSGASLPDALEHAPPEVTEAFWSLRTSVDLVMREREISTVAVVSWDPAEGKSVVATGLALSFAQGGTEVLLVDADMRHPTLHTKLGVPFGEGLADVTGVAATKLVRPTRVPNLSFLPAGIPDRHPADIIPIALPRALKAFHPGSRLVIVDTPSLDGIAETRQILSTVGSVILVVDSSGKQTPELDEVIERVNASGADLLGVVVNRVRKSRRSNHYYHYRRLDKTRPSEAMPTSVTAPGTPPPSEGRPTSTPVRARVDGIPEQASPRERSRAPQPSTEPVGPGHAAAAEPRRTAPAWPRPERGPEA